MAKSRKTKRALPWPVQNFPLTSAVIFLALSSAMFAPLLFSGGDIVWSRPGNDMASGLVPCFQFGFSELAKGNLPLWNPHTFCGTAWLSNFNSALLYPPNWMMTILPLSTSINLLALLHVALAGWGTAMWCYRRGNSSTGSVVGGVIFMFSGAYFAHTYAGHEQVLASTAWAPIVLLALDGIFDERLLWWSLIGMLAVAMQLLAGFVQIFYYTALVGGIYSLLRLIGERQRLRAAALAALVYVGGVAIAAAQLLPGLQFSKESIRGGGTAYEFAAGGSLPPENLATLLAPGMLGDINNSPYFGKDYPWEVLVFCGTSTLILAAYGIGLGSGDKRRFALTLLCISTVLALGVFVPPVFKLVYYHLPGFANFRVTGRFSIFITLQIAMLAAIGFDVLTRAERSSIRPVLVAAGATVAFIVLGIACANSGASGPGGAWGNFVAHAVAGRDRLIDPAQFESSHFLVDSGRFAQAQLVIGGIVLALTAVALLARRRWQAAKFALAAVTLLEMFIFAHGQRSEGPMLQPMPESWRRAAADVSSDARMLHPMLAFASQGMVYGYNDLAGYDPVGFKRYADLTAVTQGFDPDRFNFMPPIGQFKYPPLFQMLRCEMVCFANQVVEPDGTRAQAAQVMKVPGPMHEVQLVPRVLVRPTRDAVFAELKKPDFDPRTTVVLESKPDPAPAGEVSKGEKGWASVEKASTDTLEIKAFAPVNAILVITDSFSRSWKARPLEAGPQASYQVMPANYALRAIPLAAGRHHLIVEYVPASWTIGKFVSIIASLGWICAMGWPAVRRYTRSASGETTGEASAAGARAAGVAGHAKE